MKLQLSRLTLLMFALALAHRPAMADDGAPNQIKKLSPQIPIQIDIDQAELKELLEKHLSIITAQQKEELDEEQVNYLAEDTPNEVKNLLRTEGYFNSIISLDKQDKGYRLTIQSGKRTTIDNISVALIGDILQDKQLGSYYKNALSNWKLPINHAFRQEDWSNSKASVLGAVTRKKYPLAKFSQTQATVNPHKQTADLKVTVESNHPIYFGTFNISGQQRYPEQIIRQLAQFKTGDPYDLEQLLDYQQALENDSHYSGASVSADFDRLEGNSVPVKVTVSEVPQKKLEAGLSFDSEYGLGGNFSYDHYNLFHRGYVGSVFLEADKYQQNIGVGISQPRNTQGHYWTANLSYKKSKTQKLAKQSASGGIWYVREDPKKNTEWRLGVEGILENATIANSKTRLGKSYATLLTASWKRHNIETLMRPQNGYFVDGKISTTVGKVLSSSQMARAYATGAYYFTPENTQLGTVVARGNLGYVYANQSSKVPTSLMFRTGGATTVRGYELDSIGKTDDLGNTKAVLPDRALAVASLEYQYPIKQDFALAVFHDVGDVALNFKKMKFKQSSGVGVRWFSPVAPFSFDLAYGHQDKKIRWHISLGTRF